MLVSNMTGVILAGGENRRMPVRKAFIPIQGTSILDRTLAVLRAVFPRLLLVTREPGLYADRRVPLIGDAVEQRGPLTGIYSALRHVEDPYVFCVACDMPFLNRDLIAHLASLVEGYDAVVPRVHGRLQPLHAVYGKALLPGMARSLQQDRRAVHDLFSQVRTRYVEEPEIARFDPQFRSFVNVNTPEDLARITAVAASGGGR